MKVVRVPILTADQVRAIGSESSGDETAYIMCRILDAAFRGRSSTVFLLDRQHLAWLECLGYDVKSSALVDAGVVQSEVSWGDANQGVTHDPSSN